MPDAAGAIPAAQVMAGFDAVATGYDTHGVTFFTAVGDRLVRRAGLTEGGSVLDAGCGVGAALVPAAAAAGPAGQVTGIDISAQMLGRAAVVCAAIGLGNVRLVRADAHQPPFAAASFDAVVASMMIFLLPDPRQAIRAWLTVLRPGGTLAFSWNAGEDPRWRQAIAAVDARVPGGAGLDHLLHHSPFGSTDTVEAMLAEVGYTGITTIVRDTGLKYASPGQWWTVSWDQAARIVWQRIPREQRLVARDEAFRRLEPIRDADGGVTRRTSIGYTTARRPG